jgi:hypothetical protein
MGLALNDKREDDRTTAFFRLSDAGPYRSNVPAAAGKTTYCYHWEYVRQKTLCSQLARSRIAAGKLSEPSIART